jgi:hypothetical protein
MMTALMTLNSLTNSPLSFSVQQYYPLLTMWFQQALTLSPWKNVSGWTADSNVCSWYGITCQTMDLGDGIGIQNVVTEIDFYDNNNDSRNNYVGTIPADLGLLTMLKHFDLYNNVLTGTLTGTLPASIGQWTALTYFDVSYNFGFYGTLPASIGQWTSLTYFNVRSNALSGTLPESIGQWTALTYFDVGVNALTGTIPASIGNWSEIEIAWFELNDFIFSMPNGICPYINKTNGDSLIADCESEITCTCCTSCSF